MFGAEAASGVFGDTRKSKERHEIRHRERSSFDAEGVQKRSHIGKLVKRYTFAFIVEATRFGGLAELAQDALFVAGGLER